MTTSARTQLLAFLTLAAGCSGGAGLDPDAGLPAPDASMRMDAGQQVPDASTPSDAGEQPDSGAPDAGVADAGFPDAGTADAGAPDAGLIDAGPLAPTVDRSNPQLYQFSFTAAQADPDAGQALGNELAALDTRVAPVGKLVVYLHGAGAPGTCGGAAHNAFLAARGFHVVSPCYVADYGVGACGNDIGGCRLEAFEGIDHNAALVVGPPDSIETRVVRMLQRLQTLNPKGDWQWFIVNGKPRWSAIVISGISHGGSSAGLVAVYRPVSRAVMLSGPLDTNQAWLALAPVTPIDRFWGFTHTGDPQHPGHLAAFSTLMVPGVPRSIDDAGTPWNGSHRLFTSAATADPHGSLQLGGASPKLADGGYAYRAAWELMYGQ